MRRFFSHKKTDGYVMLITAVVFMLLSLIIVVGLVTPTIKQIIVSRDIWAEKQTYYLAESGVEDVLYRVKDATFSQHINSVETLSINGFTATTTTSGTLSGLNGFSITTLSNQSGYQKKIAATIKQGTGVDFYYAMQSGQGGFMMSGSASIVGNILTTGPIFASSSNSITGSAIIANNPNTVEDQYNDSPATPGNSIIFGKTAAAQGVAESFKVSTTTQFTELGLDFDKTGGYPSDITLYIVKDKSGSPSSSGSDILFSTVLPAVAVPTAYAWWDVPLGNLTLAAGTTYWIVLQPSNTGSDYYIAAANLDSSYATGTAKSGLLSSGAWSATGYDMYFRLYRGGLLGMIMGQGPYSPLSIGSTASDTVWAHDVVYATTPGKILCQNAVYNNTACTQTADPTAPAMPLLTSQISEWEAEASAGTVYNGNYTSLTYGGETLGPEKIIGNLTVSGSNVLTVAGTLYITGNLNIFDGSTVQLAPSYGTNSGVIVVDGQVTIDGSSVAEGSGQSGSYILLISNSTCPTGSCSGSRDGSNAMEIIGSGSGVILNAQNGTLEFTGSSDANEATANQIIMSGSTKITYKTGMANPTFSSGPSGGVNITGWSELSQ